MLLPLFKLSKKIIIRSMNLDREIYLGISLSRYMGTTFPELGKERKRCGGWEERTACVETEREQELSGQVSVNL